MNRKQRIALAIGLAAIALAAMFPPCSVQVNIPVVGRPTSRVWVSRDQFDFIFKPSVGRIYYKQLFLEFAVIVAATGAAVAWFGLAKKVPPASGDGDGDGEQAD